MPHDLLLIGVITVPFFGSLAAALLPTNARNMAAWLAGTVALMGLVLVSAVYPVVADGQVIQIKAQWLPELGLHFALRMDGFAWMFSALITGIGLLVVLYARYYMSPADPVSRFFSFLLAFMGAMLGIVLSGNLIQLVFFWELTSLFSFLLIGYWHQTAAARDGARMALIVTSAGGLCLFAGVLILGHIVGSYDLDRVLASGAVIRAHSLYVPALVLILLGAFTKSAQFPFHFWLPQAMAAPTPVSAYLHSATMVKGGVFLLVRLWPALGGTNEWLWLVASTGLSHLHPRRVHRAFPAGPEGATRVLHDQPPRADHSAYRPRHTARASGCDLPHHESCDVQSIIVHGGRDHRPRNRHARSPSPQRPVAIHAHNGDARDGCRCCDGRSPSAQRFSVQGNVLRRNHRNSRQLARRPSAAVHRYGSPACSPWRTLCVSYVKFSSAPLRKSCRAPPGSRRSSCASPLGFSFSRVL